jgi:hypothetical protein
MSFFGLTALGAQNEHAISRQVPDDSDDERDEAVGAWLSAEKNRLRRSAHDQTRGFPLLFGTFFFFFFFSPFF